MIAGNEEGNEGAKTADGWFRRRDLQPVSQPAKAAMDNDLQSCTWGPHSETVSATPSPLTCTSI